MKVDLLHRNANILTSRNGKSRSHMITFITNDDGKGEAVAHNSSVIRSVKFYDWLLWFFFFFCRFGSHSCTFLTFSGGVRPPLVHFTPDQSIMIVYNTTKKWRNLSLVHQLLHQHKFTDQMTQVGIALCRSSKVLLCPNFFFFFQLKLTENEATAAAIRREQQQHSSLAPPGALHCTTCPLGLWVSQPLIGRK